MALFRILAKVVRGIAFFVTMLLIAGGPPLAWVWIGSQVQGGTAPSGTAIVTVIAGLVVTYMLLALIIVAIISRGGRRPHRRVRYAWNRSLRDERQQVGRGTHALEDVFVGAALLVTVVVGVWFFFFGDPGVPTLP